MVFELWVFTDHESSCFARRTQDEVQEQYHGMKLAEQRYIGNDHYIIRVR